MTISLHTSITHHTNIKGKGLMGPSSLTQIIRINPIEYRCPNKSLHLRGTLTFQNDLSKGLESQGFQIKKLEK